MLSSVNYLIWFFFFLFFFFFFLVTEIHSNQFVHSSVFINIYSINKISVIQLWNLRVEHGCFLFVCSFNTNWSFKGIRPVKLKLNHIKTDKFRNRINVERMNSNVLIYKGLIIILLLEILMWKKLRRENQNFVEYIFPKILGSLWTSSNNDFEKKLILRETTRKS